MAALLNGIMRTYLRRRFKRIESMRHDSIQLQQQVLQQLIRNAKDTEWGQRYCYEFIRHKSDFVNVVPLQNYESLQPYISKMMLGKTDVLWPGFTKWFAKSSGTTSNQSKFIPVTKEKLRQCLVPSGWDALSIYYEQRPEAQLFSEKSLIYGGSLYEFEANPSVKYGDVSAIMIDHIPKVAKPFCSPSQTIALLADWEDKIEKIVNECLYENITMMSGVPTWNIVLFKALLECTGVDHVHEIWPDLSLYLHGGVNFDPYRSQFEDYLPNDMDYLEVYNASEGYFGIQDVIGRDDMLLMCNNGVYYEFIPVSELDNETPASLSLEEVELGTQYAIVISSCSGLWRYMVGDTIEFSCIEPFRIRVTGRTKQFLNAFGEELMVSNTDKAIALTAKECNATIADYTVAPIHLTRQQKGGHHWLIEFEQKPSDINRFRQRLDHNLKQVNEDYAAKRFKNMALVLPKIDILPSGSFNRWLKDKEKLGGQHKVPRLSNNREILEELVKMFEVQKSYV